ncbi:MAG: pyridoxamine 5'-phosphate oxidase family protein [Halobacteriales archaeon]
MTTYTGAWSREEAAAFLDQTAVPVRLACRTPGGGLWMLSLWFRFAGGKLHCATGADADVVRYLEGDPDVAFEVSTNDPPYKGVRGRGTVTIDPDEDKELLRELIVRYLGDVDAPPGPQLLDASREEVAIRIDPDRVYSWDFTPRMSGDG